MYIVIPMSGIGKRFIDAGYEDPKPLIKVDGKTIIEHVIDLFPGENKFIFICNEEHLETTEMRKVILHKIPHATIVSIPRHKKGPVYAVEHAFDKIPDGDEVIVNYCDFSKHWDYNRFLSHTRLRRADGAIPSYRGFHPHMLGTDNYAFIRDDGNQWMLEIREKQPFTDNRMDEYASDGTYYFRTAKIMKKYFTDLMNRQECLNGEFYVSTVYNQMVKDGLKVSVFEIDHMLQWGAPKDLEEYEMWSNYFADQMQKSNLVVPGTTVLIPMAGRGSRFAEYTTPKPLIEVSGKPMVVQARDCLPVGDRYVYVYLKDHKEFIYPWISGDSVVLDDVTEGQACTCERGIVDGNIDRDKPLIIGTCDNGMLFNDLSYLEAMGKYDALIWTFRNNPATRVNPNMYTYVEVVGDRALRVSMKTPISSNPCKDHAVIGVFSFNKAGMFMQALEKLYSEGGRYGNEYYADSVMQKLIDMGFSVGVFEVDHYVGWGTPDDLKTFQYWQNFFHKCKWHKYDIRRDKSMNADKIKEYEDRFRAAKPNPIVADPNRKSLRQISEEVGSNKLKHEYEYLYDTLLAPMRDDSIKLLEIGIFEGKSLKMWKEYFPKAQIYGFDVVPKLLFQEDRIKTMLVNQAKRDHLDKAMGGIGEVDVIIDDGSHVVDHQQISLGCLFKHLKSGGYYIIEDVHTSYFYISDEEYSWKKLILKYHLRKDMYNTTYVMLKNYEQFGEMKSLYMNEDELKYLNENIADFYLDVRNNFGSVSCVIKKK